MDKKWGSKYLYYKSGKVISGSMNYLSTRFEYDYNELCYSIELHSLLLLLVLI